MAKGDVVMKFDAQTAAFVEQVNRAREAMEQGANASRKFGEETEKAGEKAGEAMEKMGEKVVDAAKEILGIGGAIETVAKIWEMQTEEMEKRADHLKESVTTLQTALAARGQVELIPTVRANLEKISEGKVTQEQAEQLYAGISTTMGAQLDEKGIEAATAAAVKGVTAGMSQEQAGLMGKTFAQLSTVSSMAHMGDEEKESIAYTLARQVPGGLSERQLQFLNRAHDPTKALDLIIAAAHSNESAKGLEALVEESSEEFNAASIKQLQREHNRHKLDAEGERKLRLSAIAPDARFDAMLQDPTLASPKSRRLIENLMHNGGDYIEQDLEHPLLTQQVGAMASLRMRDPAMRAAYMKMVADQQAAKLAEKNGAEALTDEAVWQSMQDRMVSEGEWRWTAAARTAWQKAQHYTGTDWRPGGEASMYEQQKSTLLGTMSEQQAKTVSEELKKQTEHLASISNHVKTRGDTKLKRDTPGQE